MKYIGIDPSLRNTAVVVGRIHENSLEPLTYKLIHTSKSVDKKKRATDDLVERCRVVYNGIHSLINGTFENGGEIVLDFNQPDFIFVETPSGAQSFKSGVSYAVSCFLISTLYPHAYTVTPNEVKKYSCGIKNASKEDMIEWAQKQYPNFCLPMHNGKINKSKAEHVADALAVSHVGFTKLLGGESRK